MFFNKKSDDSEPINLDMSLLPKHVAIIMDGNGRWAKKKTLPRSAGHKAGAVALENIITHCNNMGLKHLTVYAFSTENWKRSEEEVNAIMDILRDYLDNYFKKFEEDNIALHIIGEISRFSKDIQEKIKYYEDKSYDKIGLTVHIALNYGGRDEICRGFKNIVSEVEKGNLTLEDINEDTISNFLDTKDIPDPELVIRTSNEKRLSNFLLWQIAYSEFYFTEILWPDFKEKDFDEAIYYYQKRERRFGGR